MIKKMKGVMLELSCGHWVEITEEGFKDPVVVWPIKKRKRTITKLFCWQCAYAKYDKQAIAFEVRKECQKCSNWKGDRK
jgi:hypothetical protein